MIRQALEADLPAIRDVLDSAFGQPEEGGLVAALIADGDARISLVAVQDDRPVGHVMFSRLWINAAGVTSEGLALAPIAVLPEHQRKGIGAALVREGLEQARKAGYQTVAVLGDPAYYGRFGFTEEKALGLQSEYSGRNYMALDLNGDAAPPPAKVFYPNAFHNF